MLQESNGAVKLQVQRIYIKDVSFEAPNTPEIFKIDWNPNFKIDLYNNFVKMCDDIYEVVLRVTVTATIEENVAFLCQVKQAGIFNIFGLNRIQMMHCLGVHCPNVLFPYARECISSQVSRGTFPQLNLDPINFDMLFINSLKK